MLNSCEGISKVSLAREEHCKLHLSDVRISSEALLSELAWQRGSLLMYVSELDFHPCSSLPVSGEARKDRIVTYPGIL